MKEKFDRLKALRKECSMGDSYCKGYNAAVLDALRIYGVVKKPIPKEDYPKPTNTDAYGHLDRAIKSYKAGNYKPGDIDSYEEE